MTTRLKDTIIAYTSGNSRAVAIMADGLLAAAEQDRKVLDEQPFNEIWCEPAQPTGARR